MKCETCNQEEDCRPYGLKGAMICFACMKAAPEREREAERRFLAAIEEAGQHSDVVAVGFGAGPFPVGGRRQ